MRPLKLAQPPGISSVWPGSEIDRPDLEIAHQGLACTGEEAKRKIEIPLEERNLHRNYIIYPREQSESVLSDVSPWTSRIMNSSLSD